ncbi:MAG TPA: decaprenyl-phosphate phosphoribosyltransferase [Terriglobia bacterium]|nr:decaprenyl-phosphate phosphoribosyltransferase [Terriglobia bacterium]
MATPANSAPLTAEPAAAAAHFSSLVEALRPGQWVKNGFVFAGLIFGQRLTEPRHVLLAALAAADFCMLSSAAYLVNDVLDCTADRQNPLKRLRPVASGRLPARTALLAAVLLALVALAGAWQLDRSFFLVAAFYVVLNLAYSAYLKRVMLVDVFMIAGGFVLRVVGGAVVIHVPMSSWLIVCTTLLALFLALSKRRHELVVLDDAAARRVSLAPYSAYFLDQLMVIVTASTVMSYVLYTLSADVRTKFPGKRLELTVPFVLFGIFRYLFLVHRREEGGNPARLLFTDPVLLTTVVLWAVSVVLLIYL